MLFVLGEEHYRFAVQIPGKHWRQKISRFYYGAYNVRRAVRLRYDGGYSTDLSDHKKPDLPDKFPDKNTYEVQIKTLRDDRNLADYDHTADEADLVIALSDAERLVDDFIKDARDFLAAQGVKV